MNILIVGGGIGGLAAALSCAKSGHKVVVLERRAEFTELGAGIQLAPNAFHALDRLGVGAEVLELAVQIDRLRLMDGVTDREITRLEINDDYRNKFGYPYAVVHRTDLYQPLLTACRNHPNIELRTSCNATGFCEASDEVIVNLSDGRSITAHAVVGADGIRSSIREQIVGDGLPKVCGHTIYRSVIPMAEVPDSLRSNDVTLWAGPKWHFVRYPIAGGEFMNMAAIRDDLATSAVSGEDVATETVQGQFHFLIGDAKRLLSQGRGWKKWVLCDRDPVDGWTKGRVALLGDAAHPMLQYAAQGACMALEDAVALGVLLEDATPLNVCSRLVKYNEQRCRRTSEVTRIARRMGEEIYHVAGENAEKRNANLMGLNQGSVREKLTWLHGFNAPFLEKGIVEAAKKVATIA